jgi:hypothetical protein
MSEAQYYRGQVAGLTAHRPNDTEAILDARRKMKTAKVAAYVEKVLAEAPLLRPEQIDRIVGLMHAARTTDAE